MFGNFRHRNPVFVIIFIIPNMCIGYVKGTKHAQHRKGTTKTHGNTSHDTSFRVMLRISLCHCCLFMVLGMFGPLDVSNTHVRYGENDYKYIVAMAKVIKRAEHP